MTNSKTAILTIQRVKNYGAALQTYALHNTLNQKKIFNEVVDYHRINMGKSAMIKKHGILGGYLYVLISEMKAMRRYLLNVIAFKDISLAKLKSKDVLFDNFENKYLKFSSPLEEKELFTLNTKYDNFISGSDQVWNHTFNFSIEAFFLNFVDKTNNRIAFAPSFGISEVPKEYWTSYKESFQNFNYLSVREQEGAAIIKKIANIDATVLLDPVFLMTKEEWQKAFNLKEHTSQKPYILCYTLGAEDETALEICRKIKKEKGYDIVRLGRGKKDLNIKDAIVRWDVGPVEFLDLILNASLVVTNSFHGTAFSLNFNVPFFCVLSKENKRTSRIKNILRIVDLEDRVLYEYKDKILKNLSIEQQNKVIDILSSERVKSHKFLEKALF